MTQSLGINLSQDRQEWWAANCGPAQPRPCHSGMTEDVICLPDHVSVFLRKDAFFICFVSCQLTATHTSIAHSPRNDLLDNQSTTHLHSIRVTQTILVCFNPNIQELLKQADSRQPPLRLNSAHRCMVYRLGQADLSHPHHTEMCAARCCHWCPPPPR